MLYCEKSAKYVHNKLRVLSKKKDIYIDKY